MAQRKHLEIFTVGADGQHQQASDAEVVAAAKAILDKRIGRRDAIGSPGVAKDYLAVKMSAYDREVFSVMFLDAQNRVIDCREMFQGTLTQTAVYPREVVKLAMSLNAASLILAHNHPSGVAEPSRADEALTQTLKAALSLVDVRVLDHMVVAGGSVVSFTERGLLPSVGGLRPLFATIRAPPRGLRCPSNIMRGSGGPSMTAVADQAPESKAPKRRVQKIVLSNFKKFERLELAFDAELNVLVGDNEAGKSTVLQALDLAMSGSFPKVESLGVESLMNTGAVERFFDGGKRPESLPTLFVEVYLEGIDEWQAHGRVNSLRGDSFGLRFSCEPGEAYAEEIAQVLAEPGENFPFEFYVAKFQTFADQPYGGPRRHIQHLLIDSATINTEHAHREYTRRLYEAHSTASERGARQNRYRTAKREFRDAHLSDLNARLDVQFWLRSSQKASLEGDLMIVSDGIAIESKGRGQQSLLKTRFALQRGRGKKAIDVLMLEEPENHLSHGHMLALVDGITRAKDKQVFVATHSSLVCSRLGLRKTILLDHEGRANARLADLGATTAAFFAKAPNHHLLEFAMSRRVILVEGAAEYILIEALYQACCDSTLERDGVHVIAVGGTSFKRYLELAAVLKTRVAVVRDNDGDHQRTCVENYEGLLGESARVFADPNPARSTFEICLHQDNQKVCDALFKAKVRKKSALDYMLDNKAEAALALAEKAPQLNAPSYIREAVAWIRESCSR